MVSIAAVLSVIIFYNGMVHDNYGNYLVFEWINSGDLNVKLVYKKLIH